MISTIPLGACALALTGFMATLPLQAAGVCPGPKPESIVVNASGGAMADAMRKAFSADFEKTYGIKVIDTSPANFGKLKAMVQSGNVEWTVTEIGAQDVLTAVEEGLLTKIDDTIIDLYGPRLLNKGFPGWPSKHMG
jgi:putative spermidine/putrescine transport system substrate-binding protein